MEVVRTSTQIPHILPGMNKSLTEMPIRYGIPYDAVRGHAEALYPDYVEKLKTLKPATKEAPGDGSKKMKRPLSRLDKTGRSRRSTSGVTIRGF